MRALSGLLGERGSSLLREASEQREAGRSLARRLQHGSLPGLAARTSRPLRSSYRAEPCVGLAADEQAGVRARICRLSRVAGPELNGTGKAGGASVTMRQ